ncbi:hypothetical protein NMY22_g12707 [Coprinellus aureogranulatus]|nr:hypothetical protein NMY22_g12707 [Coprinellus aureogranulatus]
MVGLTCPSIETLADASLIKSDFALSNRRLSYARTPSTRVKLQKIVCSYITPQGKPVFEKKESFHAFIANEAFAKGSMKCAFELTSTRLLQLVDPNSNEQYVVKRFYKLSDDEDLDLDIRDSKIPPAPFTAEQHNVQIEAECVSLALGKRFLTEFFKFCKQKKVHVFEHLRFEDGFLLEEIEGPPSPASGMPQDDRDEMWTFNLSASLSKILRLIWLGEKKHITGRIIRFNGTLAHPSAHTDLAHLTVYALIHYIFGHTNRQLVFADLQGTPALFEMENGKTVDGFTLFDPMTHTVDGDSGVGDFGKDGIARFLEQHECRDICRRLGLDKSIPLDPDFAFDANEDDFSDDQGGHPPPPSRRSSSGCSGMVGYSSSSSEEGDEEDGDCPPKKQSDDGEEQEEDDDDD